MKGSWLLHDHPGWDRGAVAGGRCEVLCPELSAYLDGELQPEQQAEMVRHLELCTACTRVLREYRLQGQQLRAAGVAPVPPQLTLRLRVSASHAAVRGLGWAYFKMRLSSASRALALPTVVGTVAALALGLGLVLGVRSNVVSGQGLPDVPLGYATPPRLAAGSNFDLGTSALVVASVDANGRVYGYRLLSAPLDEQQRMRLTDQLLMSVFQPATTIFGEPTNGSVLMSIGTVDVRG